MVNTQYHSCDTDCHIKYLTILALNAAVIYLVNRFFILPSMSSPAFFQNHLSDLLALPVYLPLSLYLGIRLGVFSHFFRFRIEHVFGAVILFSLIFEGIVPIVNPLSVRDPLDVLAYSAGGIIVYGVSRVSKNRLKFWL